MTDHNSGTDDTLELDGFASTDPEQDGGHRGRKAALWTIGGLVVLGCAYVGVAAWQTGTVPKGTTVGGTQIGGLSQGAAQAKVDKAVAQDLAKPVSITVAGKKLTLDAKRAGLSYDTSDVLDGLTGFTLDPATVIGHFTGGPHRTVPTHVDKAALSTAVQQVGETIHGSPVNGSVKFNDGKVDVVRSKPGTGMNSRAVAGDIAKGWPQRHHFTATVDKQPAPLTNAEITTFVKKFANKAMSGPVTVKAGDRSTKLTPTMISGVLSTKVVDGTISPVVDKKKLNALLDKVSTDLVVAPVNAQIKVVGGDKTVVPAKDGTTLAPKNADKDLLTALTAKNRTMTVDTKPAKAQVTAAELKQNLKTDKHELVSEFVSNFPTGPQNAARTHNIQVALAKINGTYVAPGEQFSLLKALTPIDASSGYINAPVLVGGVDVPGMGGGISQVSTTLYNATFFAGLQLDEHTAHGYWISRYPMGREATLWVPTIDNKWTNDSGHGITIQAGIEGHAAVIRLYGTKVFTVTSHTGQPFNIVPPKTRVLHTKNCMTQPPVNGFDVTVTRVVRRDGKVVKNESLTTHYNPADRVICE